MSTGSSRPAAGRLVALLAGGVAAPLRGRTYLTLLYVALLFPLGLGYFVGLVVLLSVGVGLSILGVGLVILALTVGLARALALLERELASLLVGLDVARPSLSRPEDASLVETAKALFLDWAVLFELAFLLTKLFWGVVAFTLLVTAGVTTMSFLVVPLYYDAPGARVGVLPDEPIRVGGQVTVPYGDLAVSARSVLSFTGWSIDTLPEALLFAAIGVLFGVLALNALVLFGRAAAWYAKLLLDDAGPRAAARELLADWRG